MLAQTVDLACVQGLGYFCTVFPELAVASEKLLLKSPGTTCTNSSQTQPPGLGWCLPECPVNITIKDEIRRHFTPAYPNLNRVSWSVPAHRAMERTTHCSLGTLLPLAKSFPLLLLCFCESQDMAHPSTSKTQKSLVLRTPPVLSANPCFSHQSRAFQGAWWLPGASTWGQGNIGWRITSAFPLGNK